MINTTQTISDLKKSFQKVAIPFIVIIAMQIIMIILSITGIVFELPIEQYLMLSISNSLLISLISVVLYVLILVLIKNIETIESSRSSSLARFLFIFLIIFESLSTIFYVLLLTPITLPEIISILYLINLILIHFIFALSFFVLLFAINKINTYILNGLLLWPMLLFCVFTAINSVLYITIQISYILGLTPTFVLDNIFYSIFSLGYFVVRLIFVISLFFIANNVQPTSAHYIPMSTTISQSGFGSLDAKKETKTGLQIYCPYCGSQIQEGDKFCVNCGHHLN